MAKLHITILTILTTLAIIGLATISVQLVSAPRGCGSCVQFKKLTHEFEKEVIDAASTGDSNTISGLLEQYNQDVRALDFSIP